MDNTCESKKAVDRGRVRRRLLGFAPVCDPMQDHRDHASILPWALPLAGLSGTHPVHPNGLDPDRIISLRRPTPAFYQRPHISNPLMGFGRPSRQ